MDVPLGDGKETVGKDQSTLEMVAYRDMWGKGTDSYLHMMYERLLLMKELPISRRYATWRVSGRGKPALKRGPIVGAPLSRLLSLGERGASKAASAANDRSPAIHRRDLKKETTSSRSDG